jgi:hypothetical protein
MHSQTGRWRRRRGRSRPPRSAPFAILLALLVVALGIGFAVAAWLMHTIARPAYTLLGRLDSARLR